LSGGMANAGQRFADFIDKFANVQTIQRWLQNAGTAFRQLGAVLKNLGQAVAGVFRAFRQEGMGAASGLVVATQRLNELINSAAGQGVLRTLAAVLRTIANVVGNVLTAAFQALRPHLPALRTNLQQIATIMGQHLTAILQSLIPILSVFVGFIARNAQWLIPLALGLMMAHKALLLVTGAFRIVNLLLTTSPIGLILTAIALAAGLIIMYWKPISGFFQRIWNGIVAAARWAWFTILRPIF